MICVQHRSGWCATSAQIRVPKHTATNVKTLCGYYVYLPFGIARRQPDCADCSAVLAAREKREREG